MNYDELIASYMDKGQGGRPPIFKAGTPLERISEVYKETQSTRRTAEKLGICDNTVRKYLKLLGENRPSGRNPDPVPWLSRRPSPVAQWIMGYEGILPRSVKKLVELSGFSVDQFYYYFKRRTKAAKSYLASLGDLRKDPMLSLVDIHGRRVFTGMMADYSIKVDKFTLLVTLDAVLKFGGRTTFRMTFANYARMFEMPPKPTTSTH